MKETKMETMTPMQGDMYPMPGDLMAPPSEPWIRRHWILFAAILMAVGCAAVVGLVVFVSALISNSDVVQMAMAQAKSNPIVIEKLGSPLEKGRIVSGNISINNSSGDADVTIPISGPKGKGTLYVKAVRRASVWHLTQLQFGKSGDETVFDLMNADEHKAESTY